jgi:hypothetical protein
MSSPDKSGPPTEEHCAPVEAKTFLSIHFLRTITQRGLFRMHGSAKRPALYRLARSTMRRSVQALFVLVLLFAGSTVWVSYRYSVSLIDAAQSICKECALYGIGALICIHDPCDVTTAQTGPGPERIQDLQAFARVEGLFTSSAIVKSQGVTITADRIHNEHIIYARYPFQYQPWSEPKLHELRTRYKLDDVVATAASELEAMAKLRSWTRTQFRRTDYQPRTDNFNAVEILDRNLLSNSSTPHAPDTCYDPCHFFPLLHAQVMLCMGHQSRLVSITHGMTEVWSNQFGKWIIMDVDLDVHYVKNGVPLNMMEMFEENFIQEHGMVRMVHGTQSSGDKNAATAFRQSDAELTVETMIQYHRTNLDLVELRNDWLTNHYFRGHPARNELHSLVYMDPRLNMPLSFQQRLRHITTNKEDMYWTLNQAEVLVNRTISEKTLQLAFKTVTPNFDCFEITIDDARTIKSAVSTFDWQLHNGVNNISIRPVNQAGIRGVASTVRLHVSDDEK